MSFFKKSRELLNLTQGQVAEALETDQSVISKIERGTVYGRYFVLYLRLLAQKGINVSEFFLSDEALREYKKE
ncbi:helix-turn-helix domain-containing protein [Allomuricauda sp. SCSIO 65647]|uniref:helix-turn-helix domain-containing protein n=1 Tax=Allomuricauda sp. SCSIO 65647 TaxID=2908843 RepID=UPI001F2D21D8|nr:helix-turn-helix transcriptional regulator [Muricauda sp. SCSIO 65647]UJH66294.1 helix-turn-helix transcriptional regulator [Muricauda sp. SCSIO 65647]